MATNQTTRAAIVSGLPAPAPATTSAGRHRARRSRRPVRRWVGTGRAPWPARAGVSSTRWFYRTGTTVADGPAQAGQPRSGLEVGAGVFVALLLAGVVVSGAPAHEYTRTQSTCSRTCGRGGGVPARGNQSFTGPWSSWIARCIGVSGMRRLVGDREPGAPVDVPRDPVGPPVDRRTCATARSRPACCRRRSCRRPHRSAATKWALLALARRAPRPMSISPY